LKQFELALALDPGNAEAQQDAAVTMRALADSAGDDRARADLLARAGGYESRAMAAQSEKGDAAALANLHGLSGTRLLGEHRLSEALAEFREAARVQPSAARGFVGVGTVLAAQAESETNAARKAALLDESVRSFEHAIEVEPGNPDAHLNLGIITLRRHGDPNVVARQFRFLRKGRLIPSVTADRIVYSSRRIG
jgi:tetratricopeptide (TPR) repeat protein